MIAELLAKGRANARTGRSLAEYLNCDIRAVTEQIERERRDGKPICAATGANPGYYLAETPQELEEYCSLLNGREAELRKTRKALIKVLKQRQAQIS